MAKQPTNPSQTVVLCGIFLLVLGFGSTYYFFMPQYISARTDQANAQANKDGLTADINTLQSASSAISGAEGKLIDKGVSFDNINRNFPEFENVPGIYLELQAVITQASGLHKTAYSVGEPSIDSNGQVKIPVSISAIGEYGDLQSLITSLENATRPVSFSEVSFSVYTPSTSEQNTIPADAYSLTLEGYVRSEKLSAAYASVTKASPAP